MPLIGHALEGSKAEPNHELSEEPTEPPPAHTVAPIDHDALLAHCMGSLEFAEEMLTGFEDYLPERVEQIAQLLRKHDATAVADLAHGLRGIQDHEDAHHARGSDPGRRS